MITRQGSTTMGRAASLLFQKQTPLRGYAINAWLASQLLAGCVFIEMLFTCIRTRPLLEQQVRCYSSRALGPYFSMQFWAGYENETICPREHFRFPKSRYCKRCLPKASQSSDHKRISVAVWHSLDFVFPFITNSFEFFAVTILALQIRPVLSPLMSAITMLHVPLSLSDYLKPSSKAIFALLLTRGLERLDTDSNMVKHRDKREYEGD